MARRLIAQLAAPRARGAHPAHAAARRRRARRPARDGARIAALRRRAGGAPLARAGPEPRPVVLVCDVSGSMAPYARMLLQYMQASVAARGRVEAFAFGTRLTRVTRELGARPRPRAARAPRAVEDWSGGTRIGESLAELNREHGRRIGRGAWW